MDTRRTDRQLALVACGRSGGQSPQDGHQLARRERTIKFHRAAIRGFLGFREGTVTDAEAVTGWLIEAVLPIEHTVEGLTAAVYERFRTLRIEPPRSGRVERLVRSAQQRYSEQFCVEVAAQLSDEAKLALDQLLEREVGDVVAAAWLREVIDVSPSGKQRINRISYEMCVFQALRKQLLCRAVWVVGANHYRNPDDDLTADFNSKRELYHEALQQP